MENTFSNTKNYHIWRSSCENIRIIEFSIFFIFQICSYFIFFVLTYDFINIQTYCYHWWLLPPRHKFINLNILIYYNNIFLVHITENMTYLHHMKNITFSRTIIIFKKSQTDKCPYHINIFEVHPTHITIIEQIIQILNIWNE